MGYIWYKNGLKNKVDPFTNGFYSIEKYIKEDEHES